MGLFLMKIFEEVKIHTISFACDIGGNPSLCFGGMNNGSGRSCGKI